MKSTRYVGLFLSVAALGLTGCEDDPGVAVLRVSGAFTPDAVDFGEVPVGMSAALPVTLKNTGRPTMTIDMVEIPADFALRGLKGLLEGRTLAPGEEVDFELVFFPMEERIREEEIRVISDDVTITLKIKASGVIRSVPVLRLDPLVLDFGTVAIGTTQQATVTVHNTGTAPAVLNRASLQSTGADISAGNPYLTGSLPVTVPIDGSATIDIVFTPQQPVQYNDVMVFYVENSTHVPLELTLGGTGLEPAGNVVCNPSRVAFGQVERGTSTMQQVTCQAMGGAVRLLGASIDNPMFTLLSTVPNGDLVPGDTLVLDVQFRPEGLPGGQVGNLNISYNGASMTSVAVVLTGEVVPPPPDVTAITAILTWDTNQHDVDIHFLRAGGQPFATDGSDCYYANLSPDWGVSGDQTDNPFLDIDDLDGYGPETVNLGSSGPGQYDVWAHFYSSDILDRPTNATVEIHLAGALEGTYRQQMLSCNQLWHVGTVNWSGSSGTFMPSGTINMSSRGACF